METEKPDIRPTPGEWKVSPISPAVLAEDQDTGEVKYISIPSSEIPRAEADDNAALFAAAKDMFEACLAWEKYTTRLAQAVEYKEVDILATPFPTPLGVELDDEILNELLIDATTKTAIALEKVEKSLRRRTP